MLLAAINMKALTIAHTADSSETLNSFSLLRRYAFNYNARAPVRLWRQSRLTVTVVTYPFPGTVYARALSDTRSRGRARIRVQAVFIVVISFAAYAAGAVAARRTLAAQLSAAAHPLEVLLVGGLLAGVALFRRHHHSVAYFIICAAAMLFVGGAIAAATLTTRERVAGGTREFEDTNARPRAATPWAQWLSFSRAVIDYEFRLVLVAAYLMLIGPIAIASRWIGVEAARTGAATTWIPKRDMPSLDAARMPF